ncbi:MAG: class I SAM-dependent methyltransferase [Mollicutes bacterium]|nr:class I SAM-dependent methyltransferase [Mollicutes bacterium]
MKNLLKESSAYYDKNNYYEIFSIREDAEGKVRNYLENISKDKIVLDAGCGTGKFLSVLETKSKEYIGIDLSDKQLERAINKSKKGTSKFICSNLSSINLKDNSVDLIISSWVLGTITDLEERNKCLNELKRVLKEDGIIILIENDTDSEFEEIRNRNKDNRTKDYNKWILLNSFIIDKQIDTYFEFKTLEEAKMCFEVIYGEEIANKIKNKRIKHKITIFKYNK